MDSEAQSRGRGPGYRVRGEIGRVELFFLSLLFSHREGVLLLYTGVWELKKRHTDYECVCVSVSMVAEGKVRGVNRIMKDIGHKGAVSFKLYL